MSKYVMTPKDKAWIETGYLNGFTSLQMIRKLQQGGYARERIDAFIEYFEQFEERKKLDQEIEKTQNTQKDEELFKEQVEKYQKGEKLSFKESREVKRWMKKMNNLAGILDNTIKELKKEIIHITEEQNKRGIKMDKEMDDLKREIAERILDLKDAFIIEDPNTGQEATKESLMKCTISQLIELLEDNVQVLEETVNGKVQKE